MPTWRQWFFRNPGLMTFETFSLENPITFLCLTRIDPFNSRNFHIWLWILLLFLCRTADDHNSSGNQP